MSVYTTAKCGHCGETWARFNPNVPWGVVGPPVIRCAKCLKDNKTSHKLARDISPLLKVFISLFGGGLKVIYSLIMITMGFLIAMGVYSEYGSNWYKGNTDSLNIVWTIVVLMFTLGPIIFGIIGMINTLKWNKTTRRVEELFDENGGFLWSYEAYGFEYL